MPKKKKLHKKSFRCVFKGSSYIAAATTYRQKNRYTARQMQTYVPVRNATVQMRNARLPDRQQNAADK